MTTATGLTKHSMCRSGWIGSEKQGGSTRSAGRESKEDRKGKGNEREEGEKRTLKGRVLVEVNGEQTGRSGAREHHSKQPPVKISFATDQRGARDCDSRIISDFWSNFSDSTLVLTRYAQLTDLPAPFPVVSSIYTYADIH